MLRRTAPYAAPILLLILAACDTGTQPWLEAGNVYAYLDATVVQGDTGVTVNGAFRVRYPSPDRALWVGRVFHYDFGGFPQLDYQKDTRTQDSWVLMLTHQKSAVQRNDSTIFSYIDHGVATVDGDTIGKLTDLPYVSPGALIGFDNFVRYYETGSLTVTYLGGATPLDLVRTTWSDALKEGSTLTLQTTGSADSGPATAMFTALPMASLTAVENDGDVPLDVDTPPVIRTDRPLVLDFDRPLDPEHAFLLLVPLPPYGAGTGARQAFLQPQAASDHIVIPDSVLWQLSSLSSMSQVAYMLIIKEVRWKDDVFAGTLAGGISFTLPFVQASETVLLLFLGH